MRISDLSSDVCSSDLQILAGNAGVWVFPISVLLVFLVLAALYERLTLPLAVILIVPMSILAALTGVWMTDGDNNSFTQISSDERRVGKECVSTCRSRR